MKKIILGIIIGIMIGSGIGAVAYSYTAKQVSFTPNDKNWKVKTVEEAIEDLYTTDSNTINDLKEELNVLKNNEILNSLKFKIRTGSNATSYTSQTDFGSIRNSQIKQNYKYFKVSNLIKSNDNNKCVLVGYLNSKTDWVDISLDTEYVLSLYDNIGLKAYSYENGKWATCCIDITFYNK